VPLRHSKSDGVGAREKGDEEPDSDDPGRWQAWLEERGEVPARAREGAVRVWTTPVGALFLVAGIVLTVLPAPSSLFVVLGLWLLGREYAWTRRPLGAMTRALPDAWRRRCERLLPRANHGEAPSG
jgi:membrane protein required for beta-lactamase induction